MERLQIACEMFRNILAVVKTAWAVVLPAEATVSSCFQSRWYKMKPIKPINNKETALCAVAIRVILQLLRFLKICHHICVYYCQTHQHTSPSLGLDCITPARVILFIGNCDLVWRVACGGKKNILNRKESLLPRTKITNTQVWSFKGTAEMLKWQRISIQRRNFSLLNVKQAEGDGKQLGWCQRKDWKNSQQSRMCK